MTEVDGAVQVILEVCRGTTPHTISNRVWKAESVCCSYGLQEHVKKAFPDHSFLGEESVDPGAAASAVALNKALKEQDGFMWVVSGWTCARTHLARTLLICRLLRRHVSCYFGLL